MIERYGWTREELLTMTAMDIRSPEEGKRLRDYLEQFGDRDGFAGTWRHRRRDGSTLWVEITTHSMTLDGRRCRMVIANDVTEARAAREQSQLLERAVQSSTSGIVVADARKEDFPITFVNAAFERITGYSASEVLGRNCRFLQGSEVDQPELEAVREALRSRTGCRVLLRNFRKDGALFWNDLHLSPVRDESDEVTHFVGVQNDLTDRRRVEAELARAVSHDSVTDLPLYPVIEAQLALALAKPDAQAVVLVVNLDRFHGINESLGHVFGDSILRTMAARLRERAGKRGQVARVGGDEFVVILIEPWSEDLRRFAEGLREAIAEPIESEVSRLSLTASIGISHMPEHGSNPSELLRRAEAAMTKAKRDGRDSVCEFSSVQMREIEDRLLLGARLRQAARQGDLELNYQPLIARDGVAIAGFEALLRWTDSELGAVSPARFIPIAESLGLMPEIGQWVVREACRQIHEWDAAGLDGFTVSLNFSAQELQRRDVVELVRSTVDEFGVEARRLEIEITESSLMERVDSALDSMAELKRLGVGLSLDDFGTGYSSLAYLRQFSLDKLKIDRSFVCDLPHEPDAAAIARTIVAIGHQLRLAVVAEGVETVEQVRFLHEIGCDLMQGYLFSPPVSAERATEMLHLRSGAGVSPT